MKVAIVQETVDIRRGGAESSVIEMATAIARLGPDVTILHAADGGRPTHLDNVTLQPVPAGGLTRALRTYRFVRGVHQLCRLQRFDVVHAVTPVLCANVYQPRGGTYPETVERSVAMVRSGVARMLRRLGKRFNLRQGFLMQIEKTLLTKRTARVSVAALSDYVRRQVASGLNFPPERIAVIFNAVDTSALEIATPAERTASRFRCAISGDQPALLFAAHNFRLKGLTSLLAALGRARREPERHPRAAQAVLLVAGRDSAASYERLARRLGLEDAVRFLGSQPEMRAFYAAADALAHPTWYDPCSRVVLESLASGVPVLASRWDGASEAVRGREQGVVIADPGDIPALAAALEEVLRPGARALASAGAAAFAESLSMDRHARELVALYERVRRANFKS